MCAGKPKHAKGHYAMPKHDPKGHYGHAKHDPKPAHEHKGHYGKPKHDPKGHYGHAKPVKHEHKGHYGAHPAFGKRLSVTLCIVRLCCALKGSISRDFTADSMQNGPPRLSPCHTDRPSPPEIMDRFPAGCWSCMVNGC